MEDNNNNFEELLNNSMKENDEKLGKIVTGKVIYISSKGEIYLDINYKSDGIIPKNEYSYDENCNPEDEVKIGDEITAIVCFTISSFVGHTIFLNSVFIPFQKSDIFPLFPSAIITPILFPYALYEFYRTYNTF